MVNTFFIPVVVIEPLLVPKHLLLGESGFNFLNNVSWFLSRTIQQLNCLLVYFLIITIRGVTLLEFGCFPPHAPLLDMSKLALLLSVCISKLALRLNV